MPCAQQRDLQLKAPFVSLRWPEKAALKIFVGLYKPQRVHGYHSVTTYYFAAKARVAVAVGPKTGVLGCRVTARQLRILNFKLTR